MNFVKITYRVSEKKGHLVTKSSDVYALLKPHFNPTQEEFYIIPMVGQECVIEKLFTGGLDTAYIDLKTIFSRLLTEFPNCTSLLVAHNHPSGNVEPSDNDIRLTGQIKEATKLLGYHFLDSMVFSNKTYYSFADEGKLELIEPHIPLERSPLASRAEASRSKGRENIHTTRRLL